jgi:hypothetical protein
MFASSLSLLFSPKAWLPGTWGPYPKFLLPGKRYFVGTANIFVTQHTKVLHWMPVPHSSSIPAAVCRNKYRPLVDVIQLELWDAKNTHSCCLASDFVCLISVFFLFKLHFVFFLFVFVLLENIKTHKTHKKHSTATSSTALQP